MNAVPSVLGQRLTLILKGHEPSGGVHQGVVDDRHGTEVGTELGHVRSISKVQSRGRRRIPLIL
jgi:hypothetical protein